MAPVRADGFAAAHKLYHCDAALFPRHTHDAPEPEQRPSLIGCTEFGERARFRTNAASARTCRARRERLRSRAAKQRFVPIGDIVLFRA
jgi:hypothetical protein